MAGKQTNSAKTVPRAGTTVLSEESLNAALAGATNPALRRRLEAALKPKTKSPGRDARQDVKPERPKRRARRKPKASDPSISETVQASASALPPPVPERMPTAATDEPAHAVFPDLAPTRVNESGWFDDQPEIRHYHRVGLVDIHTTQTDDGPHGRWVSRSDDYQAAPYDPAYGDDLDYTEQAPAAPAALEDVTPSAPPSDVWRAYRDSLAWEVRRRTEAAGLGSVRSLAVKRFRESRRIRRSSGYLGFRSRPVLAVAVFVVVFLAAGHMTSVPIGPTSPAIVAGFGSPDQGQVQDQGQGPPQAGTKSDSVSDTVPPQPQPQPPVAAPLSVDVSAELDSAQRHFDGRRFSDTVAAASRAISAGAAPIGAYVLRGRAHIALYAAANAVADLQRALEMDPGSIPTRFYLARAYLIDQQPDEAHRLFAAIAEQRPELIQAHIGRGFARLIMGDVEGALALAQAAFSETHGGPEALDLRSRARALSGDLDGALQDCDQLSVVVGARVARQWCTGTALALTGQTDLATASYEAALRNASSSFIENRQRQMLNLGLYDGPIDGTFNQPMKDALPACAGNRYCS